MSYDINIVDKDEKIIIVQDKIELRGGTFAIGGTNELSFNITYNYGDFYYQQFGEEGIRWLYGKKVEDTIFKIIEVIKDLDIQAKTFDYKPLDNMGNIIDVDSYWHPNPKNAANALRGLLNLATYGLNGYWDGD